VLECIGDNAYRLELPTQLGIHDVIHVANLNWFEPSLLEEEVQVQHHMDVIQDIQPPLLEDKILEQRTCNTRSETYTSHLVGRKRELPIQSWWYSETRMMEYFPHLMSEVGNASGSKRGGIGLT